MASPSINFDRLLPVLLLLLLGASLPAQQTNRGLSEKIEACLAHLPLNSELEGDALYPRLLELAPASVTELSRRLASPEAEKIEYALNGMIVWATKNATPAQRRLLARGLATALAETTALPARRFLVTMAQTLGHNDLVPSLAHLLDDAKLVEPALHALEHLATPAAEAALHRALAQATPLQQPALIQSLGVLRSQRAAGDLLRLAGSEQPVVREAALAALANIAPPAAAPLLELAYDSSRGLARAEAAANLLRFARRRAEAGAAADAAARCRRLLHATESPNWLRAAALSSLAHFDGVDAFADVAAVFLHQDSALYLPASEAALAMHQRRDRIDDWLALLPQAEPGGQAALITMLGQVRDARVTDAVIAALAAASLDVRLAAVQALATNTSHAAAPALLQALQRSDAQIEVAAIQQALRQQPLAVHIGALADSLPSLPAAARSAAIGILAERQAQAAADAVWRVLQRDSVASVQLAAARALEVLARPAMLPDLLEALLAAGSPALQAALQKTIVVVAQQQEPADRANALLAGYDRRSAEHKIVLLRLLSRVGGEQALRLAVAESQHRDPGLREAATRAILDWPNVAAAPHLLAIAGNSDDMIYQVLALRALARLIAQPEVAAIERLRLFDQAIPLAQRVEEKRVLLGALQQVKSPAALERAAGYLDDADLAPEAAATIAQIAATPAKVSGIDGAQVALAMAASRLEPAQLSRIRPYFENAAGQNAPPPGFRALFNGRDLSGWQGLVESPPKRAAMSAEALATAQVRADSLMRVQWRVENGMIVFDGTGFANLCTVEEFGDFELLIDWKIEKGGDSGIYLRGSPQVQIWDPLQWQTGSGGLYNNQQGASQPLRLADNPIGEWNTFRIRMIGEKVTVHLNGELVVDEVVLENFWQRDQSIYASGPIELQAHNSPLYFRNIFIRELPPQMPVFSGALFNGQDLHGWQRIGGQEGSWYVEDGLLMTSGEGGGWLSTARQFSDFTLDLEFRVPEGGNSGVFLRAPHQGDPAYTGMEVQVLDDYAARYATLKPWQYTGSIYAVQAPSQRVSKRAGEWQQMTIVCDGPAVSVTLNGIRIVDTNLIAHMDKAPKNPGLKRRAGYIGLQAHGSPVAYRNIRLTELVK